MPPKGSGSRTRRYPTAEAVGSGNSLTGKAHDSFRRKQRLTVKAQRKKRDQRRRSDADEDEDIEE